MKYNDVAQGKNNKTVRKADADETLQDIAANVGLAMVESDDPTPTQRLEMNTPGWQGGAYEPGADSNAAETFVDAFNEPDKPPTLEEMDEPTSEQLAEIENAA